MSEREEALEAARRIVFAADRVSASDGGPRKAAIKRLNAETDNQYSVVRIARALLSPVEARAEALEEAAKVAERMGFPNSQSQWAAIAIAIAIRAAKETER